MLRPSILTRLVSESNGVWEYTRFFAERNSVVRSEHPEQLSALPIPAQPEYEVPVEEEAEDQTGPAGTGALAPGEAETGGQESEFERALRQIANEEYDSAIPFFQNLVERRPDYHIGWLRLGHAQRELAMRKQYTERDEALRLFAQSIDSLSRATGHAYPPRRAQALYERSKAYFHRGRQPAAPDPFEDFKAALNDAREAFRLSPDTKHETWIGYLARHEPDGPHTDAIADPPSSPGRTSDASGESPNGARNTLPNNGMQPAARDAAADA